MVSFFMATSTLNSPHSQVQGIVMHTGAEHFEPAFPSQGVVDVGSDIGVDEYLHVAARPFG